MRRQRVTADLRLLEAALRQAGSATALARAVALGHRGAIYALRHRLRQGGQLSPDKRARLRAFTNGQGPRAATTARQAIRAQVLREVIAWLRRELRRGR